MSQSKRHSAIETATNTAVGFFGSYLITYGCFHLTTNLPTATLYATLGCTAWSLIRGYYLRRVFNRWHTKHLLAATEAKLPEGYTVSTCKHMYVDGFGTMGDALTCCKCGLSKYPEAIPQAELLQAERHNRIIRSTHPQHQYYVELANAAQRKH